MNPLSANFLLHLSYSGEEIYASSLATPCIRTSNFDGIYSSQVPLTPANSFTLSSAQYDALACLMSPCKQERFSFAYEFVSSYFLLYLFFPIAQHGTRWRGQYARYQSSMLQNVKWNSFVVAECLRSWIH